jgi:hypothetical protein
MRGWPRKDGGDALILLVLMARPGGACSHRWRALRPRHGARADAAMSFGHCRHASTWPSLLRPSLIQGYETDSFSNLSWHMGPMRQHISFFSFAHWNVVLGRPSLVCPKIRVKLAQRYFFLSGVLISFFKRSANCKILRKINMNPNWMIRIFVDSLQYYLSSDTACMVTRSL